MIELVFAFDNTDADLGIYFTMCKDESIEIINSLDSNKAKVNITQLTANKCNRAYIDIALNSLCAIPSIWATFTHGNENGVTASGTSFISVGNDHTIFKDAFFYTTSCSSGLNLGEDLISHSCRVFIGYRDKIYAFKNEYSDISLKCDIIGLTSFLTEDITAYEAFSRIKQLYTQESRKLQFVGGDVLAASLLINAREALTFKGDREARVDDFAH